MGQAVAAEEFLARAVRLLSLSLKARHEGCIHQAERLAIMAAESLANMSIADGSLGDAGMAPLTRKDADVIATGATAQELAEPQAWIVNDEALLNAGRPLPTGHVGQLVEIITAKEQEEQQNDTRP